MVKKSTELGSIKELGLSDRTCRHLQQFSIDEVVLCGRGCIQLTGVGPVRRRQLMTALDIAGYMREDFDEMSFRLGQLYADALGVSEDFPRSVADFRSNQAYEEYHPLSPERFQAFHEALDLKLDQREATVIRLSYGLTSSEDAPLSDGEIAGYLRLTHQWVQQLRQTAVRKLQYPLEESPLIFLYSSEQLQRRIETLEQQRAKWRQLHQSVFDEMERLEAEAERMERIRARLVGSRVAPRSLPVEELGLSTRASRCLAEAGITTTDELRKFSRADLMNLPQMGERSVAEIFRALAG